MRLVSSDRYRYRNDFAAITGTNDGIRCGLRDHEQVRLPIIRPAVQCLNPHSRHPDELYQNGIQRTSFLPCIDMIKERFDIIDLESGTGMFGWRDIVYLAHSTP